MGKIELFLGPNTGDRMRQIAQSIPPHDLLKAYREASEHFGTKDIVLIVVPAEADGIHAFPRPVYVEQAFRRFNEEQRSHHPLAKESAQRRLTMPVDRPAFWLVVESPDDDAIGCCAVGAIHRQELSEAAQN